MSATPVVEMVDLGLVNAKDRSLLRPGELTRAANCYYKPFDHALHKFPGRTKYNTDSAVGSAILGLRYLEFNSVSPKLVRVYSNGTNGKLGHSTFTGDTGTFSDFSDNIAIPTGLDSVYYKDRHILLTGAATGSGNLIGNNLVMRNDYIVRREGLAPVVSTPGVSLVAGGWPNNTTFPLGWYFFITTEVHDPEGNDELESSWEGATPAAINVNDSTKSVQVTRPTLVNAGADTSGAALIKSWRVYMAGPVGGINPVPTGRPDNPPLSLYYLVREVDISNTTTTVGTTSLTGFAFPGTVSAASWTNPNNVKADDNTGATTGTSTTALKATNFGFAATVPSGITVNIKLRYPGAIALNGSFNVSGNVTVALTKDGTNPVGNAKKVPRPDNFAAYNSYQTISLGGGGDLWGTTVSGAEVNSANFGVIVTSPTFANGATVDVDFVQVLPNLSSSGTIPLGKSFDFIAIPIGGGSTVLYPSNSEPPCATTADVHDGMVVSNDTANPGDVVWSLPDKPESFPKPYRMRVTDGRSRDAVVCVRALGEVVLVGLRRQLWRVNKLPQAQDSFFDVGQVKDRLCPDKGVVNKNAIATFTTPRQPILAAFVSYNGIHYTDGFRTDSLISGIDWLNMVNVDKLDACYLVNYPREHLLEFGYIPADDSSSTYPTKRLILHYHPSQILPSEGTDAYVGFGGKLKVTGPIDLGSTVAADGWLTNRNTLVTGHSDGNIYVEDRGWQDASNSNANLIMSFVTRDIYATGVGDQSTVERVWWRHHKRSSPSIILTITPWVKNTGGDYYTPAAGARWTSKARNADHGGLLPTDTPTTLINSGALERTDQHFLNESFCLEATTSDTNQGYSFSYYAFDIAGKGLSDN